ncbi:MAG TPA: outer membrane beta-barrel protein [Steroidobacteraceae bacterium]|jgi:hypothetical protein|nr:outer membrane beta-barrel protein [Steroidobacteraceae bacterium]
MTTTSRAARIAGLFVALFAACFSATRAEAQTQYFPPIPISPDNLPDNTANWFVPYVQYQYTYDNDVFRVPTAQKYPAVATLIPPGTSVADHINTGTVGIDGHWVASQQSIDYDFELDENRYLQNSDLNNTSGLAKATWNWSLATDFTGALGGSYSRNLTGFTDSLSFVRDIIDRQEYFANGRYQVGPHLAVYGGIDDTETKNSAFVDRFNDLSYQSGKAGVELATSQQNTFGFQYTYDHGQYRNPVTEPTLNGVVYNPDFADNTLSALFKYAPTDKTSLTGDVGYLRRDYPNDPDHSDLGAFSGDVWHLKGLWQPTDKTSLQVTASRDLLAYLYAASDYFVQTGVSLSPVWVQTDKLTWVLVVSWYEQSYIGAGGGTLGPNGVPVAARHDTVTSQQAGLQYTPIRALVLTFTYRHELRNSSNAELGYNDGIANAGVKFKF